MMMIWMLMYIYMFIPFMLMYSLMNFYTFKLKSNPMKQIFFLILYTLTMSIINYNYLNYSMYNLMIMIIYMSGLLVLFSYFISLMNLPIKIYWLSAMLIMMFWSDFVFKSNHILMNFIMSSKSVHTEKFNMMYYLYNMPYNFMLIYMMILLILTLMLLYKICFNKFLSLRQLNEK